VWIEPEEIERMAAVLDATPESFARRFVREAVDARDGSRRLTLRETEAHGGRCALLVGRNTCSVYDARPAHCRAFPYWAGVLTDPQAFESARSTCPGIAVEVDSRTKERAFAHLARLYAVLEPCAEPATCCLDAASEEQTFATALEADFALAEVPRRGGACRLCDRRPIACRVPVASDPVGVDNVGVGRGEESVRAVRAIERACDYPPAYAPLHDLLRSRGAGDLA
jgi:Fe-S-cluster containining protein